MGREDTKEHGRGKNINMYNIKKEDAQIVSGLPLAASELVLRATQYKYGLSKKNNIIQ